MRRRAPLLALFGADALSALGRSMTLLAIPWFVLHTTGSGTKTGVVAAAEGVGLLLSVALSGPWIDRYGARRVSVITDLATAVAVAAIPLAHLSTGLSLPALAGLSFAIGAGRSPARSAKQILLPEAMATAKMRTERATSAQEGTLSLGNLLGAPLGGLLIALLGPPLVLLVDAGTLVVSAMLVALLVRTSTPKVTDGVSNATSDSGYFAELREGLRSLRGDRLLLTLGGLAAVVNALFSGLFAVLLPAYGARVWHSSTLVGVVVAAVGAGGLVGTVLYGWLGHRLSRWGVFAASFLLFGAPTYLVLAISPHPVVLVPLVLLFSVGFGPLNPVIAGVRYDRVPVELRGRVFGVLTGGALAIMPLGPLVAGLLLDVIGLRPTVYALGAVTLVATVCPLIFPVWRQLDAPAKVPACADTTSGATR